MEPRRMTRPSEPTMTPTREAPPTVSREVIDHLVHANFWDPFSILGPHEVERDGKVAHAIRAFLPEAGNAWVVMAGKGQADARVPLRRIHPDGLFEAILPGPSAPPPYRLAIENHEGHTWEIGDPYRFGP